MSLLWLRAALVLYSLGLAHALLTLATRRGRLFAHAVTAVSIGAVFHFVSIVENAIMAGHFPAGNFHESASLLAFAVTCAYLLAHWRYRFEALALFVFPLIFVLTLSAAVSTSERIVNPVLRSGWIFLHVILLFAGYALLFVTFAAGLMYLLQERQLKSRKPRALFHRLPPLERLDNLGHKTLALGFPCMTLGIISGAIFAAAEWGTRWPLDPKMVLAFVTWLIYLALIFTRWTAGWRGRRAAYFAIVGFVAAVITWSAEGGLHSFR